MVGKVLELRLFPIAIGGRKKQRKLGVTTWFAAAKTTLKQPSPRKPRGHTCPATRAYGPSCRPGGTATSRRMGGGCFETHEAKTARLTHNANARRRPSSTSLAQASLTLTLTLTLTLALTLTLTLTL